MLIKIEIDVKPEELRTFLGLPDVSGIQEDILRQIRERTGQGAEGFDPATFLRETTLGGTRAWQRLLSAAFSGATDETDAEEEDRTETGRRRSDTTASPGNKRRSPRARTRTRSDDGKSE